MESMKIGRCSVLIAAVFCLQAGNDACASDGLPLLGIGESQGTLSGVSEFEMLSPKNMGGPNWVDLGDLMNQSVTGGPASNAAFRSLGETGDSQALLGAATNLEKLWPKDTKAYCVNYYGLFNALLHRELDPPNLQTVETLVNPALARKDDRVSDDMPRLALMQSVAIRLMLKTAWSGAPTAETLRVTNRCLALMEANRKRFLRRNDYLRTYYIYVARGDDAGNSNAWRRDDLSKALIVWQSIWESEMSEISATTLKLLRETGTQYTALAEASEPLARRAEALEAGSSDDQ
jgi:hypothetical protein